MKWNQTLASTYPEFPQNPGISGYVVGIGGYHLQEGERLPPATNNLDLYSAVRWSSPKMYCDVTAWALLGKAVHVIQIYRKGYRECSMLQELSLIL